MRWHGLRSWAVVLVMLAVVSIAQWRGHWDVALVGLGMVIFIELHHIANLLSQGARMLDVATQPKQENTEWGHARGDMALRGQDMLDRTPASPEPEGRTGPVIVSDVND